MLLTCSKGKQIVIFFILRQQFCSEGNKKKNPEASSVQNKCYWQFNWLLASSGATVQRLQTHNSSYYQSQNSSFSSPLKSYHDQYLSVGGACFKLNSRLQVIAVTPLRQQQNTASQQLPVYLGWNLHSRETNTADVCVL